MPRAILFTVGVLAFLLWPGAIGARSAEDQDAVRPAEDQILGTPATLEADDLEFLWLERGAAIRRSPEWQSPVIAIVDIRLQVPVVQEHNGWLMVRYAGWKGWVHARGGKEPEQTVPFTTAPDPEMLASALETLDLSLEASRMLGPFALYTDISDRRLIDWLGKVAANLPLAYARRYGLDPGGEAKEVVVIFSRHEDYRTFVGATTGAQGSRAGHATRGIAVLSAAGQSRDELAAVLVHELTHLLNRRVFRETTPPWLDEGMSNDLAYCKIKRWSGEIESGTLGGRNVVIDRPVYLAGGESRVDREVRVEGPMASLSLLRSSRTLLPLDLLLDLQPQEFMDQLDLRTRYDQSTFFIRYLLDARDPALATGFRSYLKALTEIDGPAVTVDLTTFLGIGIEPLNRGFGGWLQAAR